MVKTELCWSFTEHGFFYFPFCQLQYEAMSLFQLWKIYKFSFNTHSCQQSNIFLLWTIRLLQVSNTVHLRSIFLNCVCFTHLWNISETSVVPLRGKKKISHFLWFILSRPLKILASFAACSIRLVPHKFILEAEAIARKSFYLLAIIAEALHIIERDSTYGQWKERFLLLSISM